MASLQLTHDAVAAFEKQGYDLRGYAVKECAEDVENTLEIIRSFPNGRVIIVERGGHGVLEPIAGRFAQLWDDVLGFLRTGDMPNLPERVTLPAAKFAVPDFRAPGRE